MLSHLRFYHANYALEDQTFASLGLPTSVDDLCPDHFSHGYISKFLTYLCMVATTDCKPDGTILTRKSADKHASFFKCWLKKKFRGQPAIPSLHDSEWTTFRREIRATSAAVSLLLQPPLIGKTEQAT